MKKQYSKPQIAFDSFEMATNIAACGKGAEFDPGTCPVYVGGMPVFTREVQGCRYRTQDGSYGICYYVPTADTNVFAS